ncbi:Hypothetical protein MSYG_0461 [Malassezia sympodialis ATCC 42132]|uniref:Pentatricopeptide repeat-containing protein n=1 Tax=Malassezia sympodialis (strain ATCC 42132) TaxID=1230383 RepID=A0A1M8A0Z8_MALS4|nr:Hypothetical protein MSYG_0461 [Malassezia sympodialis ATCC 42132]
MAHAARRLPGVYAAAATALPCVGQASLGRAWAWPPWAQRTQRLPSPRALVAPAAEAGAPTALERVAVGLRHRSLLDDDVQALLPALIRGVRAQDASSRHLALLCAPHVRRALEEHTGVPPKLLSLALCVRTHLEDPWRVWTALRAAHPAWTPHRDDWAWIVRVLCTRDAERAWSVWLELRACGADVRAPTINVLLHALQARAEATVLVTDVGVRALDLVGLSTYVHAHMKADVPATPAVHAAAAELHARLRRPDTHDTPAWHAMLLYTGRQHGGHAALTLVQDAMAHHGLTPDAYTVPTLLLAHAAELADVTTCDAALHLLHRIHTLVRVPPSAHALAIVLRAVLGPAPDPNQVFEAHALYTEARSLYGVTPDAALVQPLVEAHCAAFVPDLDRAHALLDDVLGEPRPSGLSRLWRARVPRPVDLGLFYPLLRACAALHDVPRAVGLLRRMRACRVRVPPHAAWALARSLGEASRSWADVGHVYGALHALRAWDSDAWARVLAWMCRWRMADGAPAPPALPLQVLADMREAGVHPRPATYTVLLDFCAKTHAHLASIQAVHAVIQRDVQLEPDLVLVHALMNAYNYAGAPAQVLGIFDALLVLCQNAHHTRFLDDVTLTIVCDTCGRAGLLDAMREAVAAARALDARLITKNVWDAWVEGLARCGRLDEAVAAALDEMPRTPATSPDAKTLQTLLKFARGRTPAHAHIVARIQAELPHVWDASLAS